jgi:hypothetical protein
MSYTLPVKSSSERLSYTIHTEPLHVDRFSAPHGLVTITIRHVHEETMASVLAGTVGNAAGYGSTDAAERVGRSAAAAVRAGVTHAFSTTFGGPDVSLRYQQYNDETYCGSPRIEFGGSGDFRAIERGVEFLRWLARKADKAAFSETSDAGWVIDRVLANPSKVSAGLDRVGAVRLMGWRDRNALIGEGGAFWIADNKPRIEFATDARKTEEAA